MIRVNLLAKNLINLFKFIRGTGDELLSQINQNV